MKKSLIWLAGILTAVFVVSASLSVGFLSGLDQIWSAPAGEDANRRAVAVLLPSDRDPFWDELTIALQRTGARLRLSFEVTRYSPSGNNAREVIEKASLSHVNALLIYPPDILDVTDLVNEAERKGLPILLLENDLPNSSRRVFLGASTYQVGYEVGHLIRTRISTARRGGVLLSQSDLQRQTVRNSLFLNGLNEGLSQGPGDFALQEVISPPGRFAGEELVWSLLRKDPSLQVLVTTNPKDTQSALQTIVEANKVGKTRLVGVGEDSGLRTALSQGVIAGLITRDADEWATTLAGTLDAILQGKTVSSYIHLTVHALTTTGTPDGN